MTCFVKTEPMLNSFLLFFELLGYLNHNSEGGVRHPPHPSSSSPANSTPSHSYHGPEESLPPNDLSDPPFRSVFPVSLPPISSLTDNYSYQNRMENGNGNENETQEDMDTTLH